MKHIPWNTNIATTAPTMSSGVNGKYWSGSMTFDTVNFIVYIRPSVGLAAEQFGGLYAQTDLRKNITDNLAYVGSSWVDVTGDLSKNFTGL